MADEGNLTPEQTEKLVQFQVNFENFKKFFKKYFFKEITHNESIEECIRLLEAFQWNVEVRKFSFLLAQKFYQFFF